MIQIDGHKESQAQQGARCILNCIEIDEKVSNIHHSVVLPYSRYHS